ncbi:MAG: sulfite dehydrogenase [Gammaproteobacteria bacterium]
MVDQPSLTPVAGNGLLDRRLFLSRSFKAITTVALSGPALAAAPREPWMRTPGEPFSNYGTPSPHESALVRWISATAGSPQNGVSWTPLHDLDGTITPNGLHFERHHNGVPQIDPAQHTLVINGLVERALEFDLAALRRYPRISRILFIECGGNSNAGWNPQPIQSPAGYFHGLASCSEWTGVPLRTLLEEAGMTDRAAWMIAEGADAFGMTISLPLKKGLDDCLLALYQNGEPLRPEQGYPLRLIVPGWEGVTNVKWLRTLTVTARPVMARNETSRYTELQPNGRARMFTFVMEVKSLLTMPSPGSRLAAHGYYELSGLAWSGYGRIAAVEVSADGGETWADAALNEPVLPRAFTRFRIPWHWQGEEVILQSRATDDTGAVQPARAALLNARGRHGYFHYNAIVSWAVGADGTVTHVYPDTPAAPAEPSADPFEAPWK